MGGNVKCRMYKETQSSIRKQLEKGVKLDTNICLNQIVLIKKDVTSGDDNVRKPALEMLNFLINLNIEEFEIEIIKMLHDNATNKLIKNVLSNSIKQKIIDTISENMFNFTNILSPWKNQNTNQLTNIMEDVCANELPKEKCNNFFINVIVSEMMAIKTDNQVRDALIDIAFMMSTILPISDLSSSELESFLKDVNTKYIANIGDLRDKDYANWHNLWIFLVRFCDKHIHYSMELTNRLLRVVEFAFRNSSIQQRLKGYDCWKELIDNASLDMNHMCSAKQIKLLITPLKAKFSKQEVVICKRFDVFTYLLEKLQQRAVLCLTEFLEFCFGPVGDNKDASKTGQGKSVPQIWTKSAKVLIEIIGHSHGKTVSCLSTEDVIKLEKPIINFSNIVTYYKVIINSVGESCSLLKEVDIESKRETVIKCMWKSVFNVIITNSSRGKCFEELSKILDNYILQSREHPYFKFLLRTIFSVLMSYDPQFVFEVIEYILKQLLTILFTIDDFPSDVADKFKVVLTHWFSKICVVETKLNVMKQILTLLIRLEPSEGNINHVGKIWLCLASELIIDFKSEEIEKFEDFNDFFIWPAYRLQYLDETTKKQTILHWMKLYRKVTMDTEDKKLNVMKELQKVFQTNPLLNPNVVSLLNVMSQFEIKFTKLFVNKLMIVSSQILQLPNIKTEEEQKITALVMQYFEPSLECFDGDTCDEVVKNICKCIEHILCIHKGYKLMDTLVIFVRNSPAYLRSKFSKSLSPLLLDLYNKESDVNSFNAKELQKALQVLNIEAFKKDETAVTFIPPGGRSARIANMAKSSPRSPKKKGKTTESSPTALRLFGKDLDTLSPLRVKGSQLQNTTPKSKKRGTAIKTPSRSSVSINDEKSSDFVPINTEVKLQPEKLSRHQKEMLKKRREDIPALYQDLSQSLSQDIFSSSSSSKGFEKSDKGTSHDKTKVIVEVVRDHVEPDIKPIEKDLPPKPADELPKSKIVDVNVPNSLPDAVLTSEVIPEAPAQNIGEIIVPNTDLNFEANEFPEAMLPSELIPDEVIHAIKEVTVSTNELNTEEMLGPEIIDSHKVLDPEETMIEEEKQSISDSHGSKSKDMPITESSTSQISEAVGEKNLPVECVVEKKESFKSEGEEKEKRRKQRMELELQKLKMDIVGAEEFFGASRRTRTREKPKKLDETSQKKIVNEEKSSPHRRRRSVEFSESKEPVTEKNRRKTVGGWSQDAKSEIGNSSNSNSVEDAFIKTNKGLETPKRGRKPKSKHDDSIFKGPLETVDKTPTNKAKSKKGRIHVESVEYKQVAKGEKRKRSNGDEESEDIIESSQQFHSELTPVFNASKRRSLIETSGVEQMDKSEEKTLVEEKSIIKDVADPIAHNEIAEEVEVEIPVEEIAQEVIAQEITIDTDDKQIEIKSNEAEDVHIEVNTSQDTTVTQESTQDLTQLEDQIDEVEALTEGQIGTLPDTQTQNTVTSDTLTQTDFSMASEEVRPPFLYFDLPKKPELTESERMMCQMDTMSICMDPKNLPSKLFAEAEFEKELEIRPKSSEVMRDEELLEMNDVLDTPKSKSSGSLPSSPITVETPNRTSELLNNTLDISPINSKSSSDDGESDERNPVACSINFKADMEELDKMEKDNILELILEKKSQRDEKSDNVTDVKENEEMSAHFGDVLTDIELIAQTDENIPMNLEEMPHETKENLEPVEVTSSGEFQVHEEIVNEIEDTPLQTVEILNEPEDVTNREGETSHKKLDMPDLASAKSTRDNDIHERASRLLNMVHIKSPMISKLYGKRRNITMSPSTARIKKLMSNFNQKSSSEETIGEPLEEDLLTFSRDVPSPLAVPRSSILKRKISDSSDSDGISPCVKRKRVNFSDPCLTSKKVFIKDDYNLQSEMSSIFEGLSEFKCAEDTTSDVSSSSEKLTETENVETEPSLEMVNALMLKKDKPIYPKLVDCKEDVILILKRVTSPMFITTLVNKLKNKEIKTIGDLARQSEAEINRFPFKVPVVPNVYKALDSYYKKNVEKPGPIERPNINGVEQTKRQGVIKKLSPKKVDYRAEFRQMIEKSKLTGTFDDLLKTLLSSVEKQRLLALAKTHYKLEINDFLLESDYKLVVKHITQKVGLSNVFEMLTGNFENSEEESVYYDCILKQSLEKRSLSNIWENRSLFDIRNGLEESINRNAFSRQEVLDQCLLPLIESPNDISGYLNQISVVQLSDIVVQRLADSNPTEFITKILNSQSSEFSVTLSKEVLVHVESPGDVVDIFKDCINARNEEQRSQIMVEMFKYISGNLSVHTLLELHVDFLKRISSLTSSSEK